MSHLHFIDTHCHIHEAWRAVNGADATATLWDKAGRPDADEIIQRAVDAGVQKMLCVGTTLPDSRLAIEFVASRPHTWATIGIHPHEASTYAASPEKLAAFAALLGVGVLSGRSPLPPAALGAGVAPRPATPRPRAGKIVAVGECGLDYFYNHSPKADQVKVLRFQIELALKHDVPMVFHIREAFDDFWPIFDQYPGIRGVVHSFTANETVLAQILSRGLYVGLNGIMTFTKQAAQLAAARAVPRERLVLETDAPFLTPHPFRGTICEPKHTVQTAQFLADLRGETLEELAQATTANAQQLFGI